MLNLDYCWKCHMPKGHPDDTGCWCCEQVNAYSPDYFRRVYDLERRYPGFHSAYLDAEGNYKRCYDAETGALLAR